MNANQPTNRPTRKVKFAAFTMPLAVAAVWAIRTFAGVDVPPEVAVAAGSALAALAAYLTKEKVF